MFGANWRHSHQRKVRVLLHVSHHTVEVGCSVDQMHAAVRFVSDLKAWTAVAGTVGFEVEITQVLEEAVVVVQECTFSYVFVWLLVGQSRVPVLLLCFVVVEVVELHKVEEIKLMVELL
eukprot:5554563-Amphidinium_carterae.1